MSSTNFLFKTSSWYQIIFMTNAKLNTRILGVLFNGEIPTPLAHDGFYRRNSSSPPNNSFPRMCMSFGKRHDHLNLGFATGSSFIILFEHNSKVILLRTPYYLAIDMAIFLKVCWFLFQYTLHVYIWCFKTIYDD